MPPSATLMNRRGFYILQKLVNVDISFTHSTCTQVENGWINSRKDNLCGLQGGDVKRLVSWMNMFVVVLVSGRTHRSEVQSWFGSETRHNDQTTRFPHSKLKTVSQIKLLVQYQFISSRSYNKAPERTVRFLRLMTSRWRIFKLADFSRYWFLPSSRYFNSIVY